jgi:hypothetical protein
MRVTNSRLPLLYWFTPLLFTETRVMALDDRPRMKIAPNVLGPRWKSSERRIIQAANLDRNVNHLEGQNESHYSKNHQRELER